MTDIQRARLLRSAAQVVAEQGFGQMSVARITEHAHVSRRTFYEVFADREDCFLALFEDAVVQASGVVVSAYEREQDWSGRVRAGLVALLRLLEERPQLGALLVLDALRAGPRVLARRAEVLARVGAALDGGGSQAASDGQGPSRRRHDAALDITGEGVVGAVFSVIHARLLAGRAGELHELLNSLMSVIVLPYLGPAVAHKELTRRRARAGMRTSRSKREKPARWEGEAHATTAGVADPLAGLPMRLTYRTLRVLGAIGQAPGASNHLVAQRADVLDQGQMSKLLARLERLGLIENEVARAAAQPSGKPNAWFLTARGGEVVAGTLEIGRQ